MDDLIKMLTEALTDAMNRFGSKFTIALFCGGALYLLCRTDKIDGVYSALGIFLICISYFIFDTIKRNKEKTETKEEK